MAGRRGIRAFLGEVLDDGDGKDESLLEEILGRAKAPRPSPTVDDEVPPTAAPADDEVQPDGDGATGLVDPFAEETSPTPDPAPSTVESTETGPDPSPGPTAPATPQRARPTRSEQPPDDEPGLLSFDGLAAAVTSVGDALPSLDDVADAADSLRRGAEDAAFPNLRDAGDLRDEFDAEFEARDGRPVRDLDHDGNPDATDTDLDGDKVPNAFDLDDDDDGLVDVLDPDDDNDDIRDRTEELTVAPSIDGLGQVASDVNAVNDDDAREAPANPRRVQAATTVVDAISRDEQGEVVFTPARFLANDLDADGDIDEFDIDIDGDGLRNDNDIDDDDDRISDIDDVDRDGDGFRDDSEERVRNAQRRDEFDELFLPADELNELDQQARADAAAAEAVAVTEADAAVDALFADEDDDFGTGSVAAPSEPTDSASTVATVADAPPASGSEPTDDGSGTFLDSIADTARAAFDTVVDHAEAFFGDADDGSPADAVTPTLDDSIAPVE